MLINKRPSHLIGSVGESTAEMQDSTSAAVEKADASSQQGSTLNNFVKSFRQDLDVAEATLPLTFLCGITGFMDAIGFTATSVWVAFQTGNSVTVRPSFSPLILTLFASDRQHCSARYRTSQDILSW